MSGLDLVSLLLHADWRRVVSTLPGSDRPTLYAVHAALVAGVYATGLGRLSAAAALISEAAARCIDAGLHRSAARYDAFTPVEDEVRPEARDAVDELREMGVDVAMITGDAQQVADAVAADLGITQLFAEVLPEDKDQAVTDLQQRGTTVAMVGIQGSDGARARRAIQELRAAVAAHTRT